MSITFKITDYSHSWSNSTKTIVITTDWHAHVRCAFTYTRPTRVLKWTPTRGDRFRCYPHWAARFKAYVYQQEPGLTFTHTFELPAWLPYERRWYTFIPDPLPAGWRNTSPIFEEMYIPTLGPYPPYATPDPVPIPVTGAILRCANRYAHWDGYTYYAAILQSGTINMFRKAGDSFVLLDELNQPTSATNKFTDLDTRISADGTTIHCVYYERDAPGPTQPLRYVTFSTTTDTWGTPELVVNVTPRPSNFNHCSLSLDAVGAPHIVYSIGRASLQVFVYRNRAAGFWSAQEDALVRDFRITQACGCDHDLDNNHFHAHCVTNTNGLCYRRRNAGGGWGALYQHASDGVNTWEQSLGCDFTFPHLSGTPTSFLVWHREGYPPSTRQGPLSTGLDRKTNVIIPPEVTPKVVIAFRSNVPGLWYVYRPSGGAWQPETKQYEVTINILTGYYIHPNIAAHLWNGTPINPVNFYAWEIPA